MVQQLLQRVTAPDEEQGASAVEYGFLVTAIAALVVVVVLALGGAVQGLFSDTCTEVGTGAGRSTASCNG